MRIKRKKSSGYNEYYGKHTARARRYDQWLYTIVFISNFSPVYTSKFDLLVKTNKIDQFLYNSYTTLPRGRYLSRQATRHSLLSFA